MLQGVKNYDTIPVYVGKKENIMVVDIKKYEEEAKMIKELFEIYKFRSMYPDAEERKKELMEKNKMMRCI